MKIKALILLLIVLPFLSLNRQVSAEKSVEKSDLPLHVIEAKKLDNKASILSEYLSSYNSPMQDQAQDFVDAANAYGLDWKLLPSIAGVESTFGKHIPGGFNAWGWGVYGTQAIYFNSWRDGMFTIAKGLRENYLNKGLTDPYAMNRIYAASPTWGSNVSYFMQNLDKFAQEYEARNIQPAKIESNPKIAANSGQLETR